MIRWLRIAACICVAIAVTLVVLPGCHNPNKDDSAKNKSGKSHDHDKDHEHPEAGPHGGPLAEWGKDEYHGELVIDHDAKMVTVYILDGTATKAPKIDHEKITDVKVAVAGKLDVFVLLKHDAKKSDDKGIAFVAIDEMFAKPVETKFNIHWKVNDKANHDDVTYTPKKAKTAALSLTPGGIYTAADIKANGGVTPKEKYAGMKHAEGTLKEGDKICPYSKDKANPDCVWVIQGQTYEFCCPPCIDQFLKVAHNEPTKVKDAKEYVHHAK